MIRLSGVSRTFTGRSGTVEALRDIELEVAEGEFVAVVGRSGCGKSTLLRLVAGLLPVTAGEVRVSGERVTSPRRDISMMFQKPALLPWRSVLDNVLLPVQIFGWRKDAHRDPVPITSLVASDSIVGARRGAGVLPVPHRMTQAVAGPTSDRAI